MINNNGLLAAQLGCKLKTKYNEELHNELCLGQNFIKINNKLCKINLELTDVYEVRPVTINNVLYYITNTNDYSSLVSSLIRLKYSADDELALIANTRLGKHLEEEEEFLNWRQVCKETAKNLINE